MESEVQRGGTASISGKGRTSSAENSVELLLNRLTGKKKVRHSRLGVWSTGYESSP